MTKIAAAEEFKESTRSIYKELFQTCDKNCSENLNSN